MFWWTMLVLWLISLRLAKWGRNYQARHGLSGSGVSRNQTGPKWEQDEPYNECFDYNEIGDDL